MNALILVTAIITLLGVITINRKVNTIMATQAEHAAELVQVKADLVEAQAELLAKIQELSDAIANAGNTTPEVDAALAEVKALSTALKDVVS